MKTYMPILIFLFLLAACKPEPSPTVTAVSPTKAPPTDAPSNENTPTAVSPQPTQIPENDESALFKAGLIASQQAIVDEMLPTAPLYHLQLTVSDDLSRISGEEQLRYTNQEGVPVDALYFHLFPNLLGESINVSEATVDGNPITPSLEEEDDSILRLSLDSPLPPDEQVEVEIWFETAVPDEADRNYGILANMDGVLAMAHFYPQLAVYDDEGWNTTPPSPEGDVTYADSSFYIVELTASAEQVIVTSGIEIESATNGDTQTTTYAAGPARDFYAVMSDDYVKQSETIGETTINSYAPSAYADGSAQALASSVDAMAYFSAQYAPYPYTEMDVASTPTLALGVEYPGLFVLTNSLYEDSRYADYIEGTTIHEMGHQWFYNLVGNDQLDEPWLDESLTQYITLRQFEDLYGEDGWDGYYGSLNGRWARTDYAEISIGQPVSAYKEEEGAYSSIIYGRGPIFVTKLEEMMGRETFDVFLRDYVETYSWKIANTEDFKALAESHCDCDLTDMFEEWVY